MEITRAKKAENTRRAKAEAEAEAALSSVGATMMQSRIEDEEREEWSSDRLRDELFGKDGVVVDLPISVIDFKENVRKIMDADDSTEMKDLVRSIRDEGLLQLPVIAVMKNDFDVYRPVLISGQRRLRAMAILGHRRATFFHKVIDDPERRFLLSFAENKVRNKLSVLDTANAYQEMASKFKRSKVEMATMFGVDKSVIFRYLKIAAWPESAKSLIASNTSMFKTRDLFKMAAKKYSDEQLLYLIKKQVGLVDDAPEVKRAGATSEKREKRRVVTSKDRKQLIADFELYISENSIAAHVGSALRKALVELNLID